MWELTRLPTITSGELGELAARAGRELGWSPRYVSLLRTSVSAVVRANGFTPDVPFPVDDWAVAAQLEQLTTDPVLQGRSDKTIDVYASSWRRLMSLARPWAEARDAGDAEPFWHHILDFENPRASRPTGGRRGAGPSSGSDGGSRSDGREVSLKGASPAVLPNTLTASQAIELIHEIISRVVDPGTGSPTAGEDSGTAVS
jgi:hypothetical protein